MTPLEIQILLHYHINPRDDFSRRGRNAAVDSRIDHFVMHGILGDRAALLSVPLPRLQWVVPSVQE